MRAWEVLEWLRQPHVDLDAEFSVEITHRVYEDYKEGEKLTICAEVDRMHIDNNRGGRRHIVLRGEE
jgi:hypothetical protein